MTTSGGSTNIKVAMASTTTTTSSSTALPIPTPDIAVGGRVLKQRSPLVQILKEVPGYSYTATATTATAAATTSAATIATSAILEPNKQQQQQQQKLGRDVAGVTGGVENLDLNVPIPRFPTSKLAGRLSTVGNGLREVGNSSSGVAMRRGNNTSRLFTSLSADLGPAEVQPSGGGEGRRILRSTPHASSSVPSGHTASAAPPHPRPLRRETANPRPTQSSAAFSVPLQEQSPPHLPTIKKPSLSGELRRQVLFNTTSPRLKDHQKNQEAVVRVPARAPSRQNPKGGKGPKGARVKTKFALSETEPGDVTKLVKGLCQTEDETVVREKLRQLLKEEKRVKTRGNANNREPQQQHIFHPDVPDSTTTNLNDTRTTGTATKNLRTHFTHQKISHKREVLERAFGWDSQFIEDAEDINEELGRQAAALGARNGVDPPAPGGESASEKDFVGAVKVAGSIGSKASSGMLPGRGSEWVDEEEPLDVDTVMVGNWTVRKGSRNRFQLDQSQVPQTPLVRSRRKQRHTLPPRTSTRPRNSAVQPASLNSNSNMLGAKRSLQRFDRVEDWLDYQRSHTDDSKFSSNRSPTSLDNISTQTANPTTPRSIYTRSSHRATSQKTLSSTQFEWKYPLSLAHLPYIKHNLKSGGKGTARSGGVVTISPPTDSDLLGYVHLDIKGKRYVYTIIPGSVSGSEIIEEKKTMIIVHPRHYKNSNNPEDREEDDEETIIAQDRSKPAKEQVYTLPELPGKHLRIVKFASKFVEIVRRGTVVVRIEGLNPGSPTPTITTTRANSRRTAAATAAKTTATVQQNSNYSQPSNSLWEWYRAEIYADGRFEFTIIPRGGVINSAAIMAENGGKLASSDDGTIMLVGGVVRIKFASMHSRTTPTPTITTTTTNATNNVDGGLNTVPRFCGGNLNNGSARSGNVRFRKVYAEISSTLAATTSSSSSASGFSASSSKPISKQNIKSKAGSNTKTIWTGMVELGPGSSPDVGVATTREVGRAGTATSGGGGSSGGSGSARGDELVCAGFATEMDWARRMWIECRRKAGNLGNSGRSSSGRGGGFRARS